MDRRIVARIGLVAATAWRVAFAYEPPTFIVKLHGHQAVSRTTLERTEIRVQTLMSRAGVRLLWHKCPLSAAPQEACADAPAPNEAVLRLRPGSAPLSAHGCGVTLVPDAALTHYVTIFVECTHEAADRLGLPQDAVLAGVVAHELGHVLLGPEHAGSGLMQARPRPIDWLRVAHDDLAFSETEAHGMREALANRLALAR